VHGRNKWGKPYASFARSSALVRPARPAPGGWVWVRPAARGARAARTACLHRRVELRHAAVRRRGAPVWRERLRPEDRAHRGLPRVMSLDHDLVVRLAAVPRSNANRRRGENTPGAAPHEQGVGRDRGCARPLGSAARTSMATTPGGVPIQDGSTRSTTASSGHSIFIHVSARKMCCPVATAAEGTHVGEGTSPVPSRSQSSPDQLPMASRGPPG
jgi:hypothetical protein